MTMGEVAGGVVVRGDGKLILVEQHGNSWSFPKGGVEDGETLEEGARREIREETGIEALALVAELGSFARRSIGLEGVGETDAPARRRTLYLFRTDQELRPQDDAEITGARWVSIDEALSLLTHPKDREFLASVRDTIEACLKRD